MDLGGRYLSDNPNNPRKWPFPAGTTIPAGGYLLVWADEDGSDSPEPHANFKFSAEGEQILLVDSDADLNALLDWVSFDPPAEDVFAGRTAADPSVWAALAPTPGALNP